MVRTYLILICVSFLFSKIVFSQTDEIRLDCIKNHQVCNYENEDQQNKLCLDPYYPINDYINYGEDCLELFWLFKYSWILNSIDEKIMFNAKNEFTRLLLLNGKNSRLIRVEKVNDLRMVVIKKFELDSIIEPDSSLKIEYQVKTFTIQEKDYHSIEEGITNSKIYSLEAHPINYFAFSDIDIVCFESYGYGGYTMTDLFIPFIKSDKELRKLLTYIEKIEKYE